MPYPDVRQLTNGAAGDSATFNAPLQDLIARTDHLLGLVSSISSQRSVRLDSVPVSAGVLPGTPVYLDTDTNTFRPALAALSPSSDYNLADPTSLWRGVALEVVGSTATIVVSGSLTLATATWAAVIDTGAFAPGRYFLSDESAGTITQDSGTLGIYIGDLVASGEMVLAGQGISNFLNHVHSRVTLLGDPAGTVNTPGPMDTHVITAPNSTLRGWLPADGTSFPGFVVGDQIPTGATFGYNLQHPDESLLRSLFPPVPLGSAQFDMAGQILSETTLVVNQFGIWWMTDAYETVPWAPDYSSTSDKNDVNYWTVRIPASTQFVDIIYQQLFAQLVEEFDQIGVSRLSPGPGVTRTPTTGRGDVTVTNDGVRVVRSGAGTRLVGTAGNAASGFRHDVSIDDAVEHPLTVVNTGSLEHRTTITGDGILVAFILTHDLGFPAAELTVDVWDTSGGAPVSNFTIADNVSGTSVDITFAAPVANAAVYRVTVRAPEVVYRGPLSTNGVITGGGTLLGIPAYRCDTGAYFEFYRHFGEDLPTGVSYRPTVRLMLAIDTPEATPVAQSITVEFYVVADGGPVNTASLVLSVQRSVQTGQPGVLQTVTANAAAFTVVRGRSLVVRVLTGTAAPAANMSTVAVVGAAVSLLRNA